MNLIFKQVSYIAITFLLSLPVFAHAPHDDIQSIVISPNYKNDNTAYGIVRFEMFKSINRGLTWEHLVQGLDGSAFFQSIAIAPKFPQVLFASTSGDGIFKSEDGGNSWQKNNQGLDTLSLNKLYAPPSTAVVFVFATGTQGGLYRKMGGADWIKIYNNSVPISAITGFGWRSDLPNRREIIIGDKNGNLLFSADGGLTWHKIHTFNDCGEITSIATSPLIRALNNFFVGTRKCGVFSTFDAGKTFQATNFGITDLNITSVAMSPAYLSDNTVFVSTWSEAIFISHNRGSTWQKYGTGSLTTDPQADEYGRPQFGGMSISPDFLNDKTIFLAGFDGLFQSVDGGTQWKQMVTIPGSLIVGLAIPPTYLFDTKIALSTYTKSFYQSIDDGLSWSKLAVHTSVNTRNFEIAFSPDFLNDGTMFALTGLSTVAKSTNRGVTWVKYILPSDGMPKIIALSPSFADDKTLFVANRETKIYRSTDAGLTFTLVMDGHILNDVLTSLVISPDYIHDHTLIAALNGLIYMSKDNGATWSLKISQPIFGVRTILAISPNYAVDHTIFIGGGRNGLFRTTDGFTSWKKSSGVDGIIEALALSPNFKYDHTVITTVKGKGLFKSENGGDAFKSIAPDLIKNNVIFATWNSFPIETSPIRFSPRYVLDKTIFGSTMDRLYRSRDGGNSWELVVVNTMLN